MVRQLFGFLFSFSMTTLIAGCQIPPPAGISLAEPVKSVAAIRSELPQSAPNSSPASPAQVSGAISVNDVIDVKFPDSPLYNETARVDANGNLVLQLIGSLTVVGLNALDLQTEIRKRYLAIGAADTESKRYLLRAGDTLDVRFPYRPEFNQIVRVRPDGRISLPLVHSVIAEGKTAEELNETLKSLYKSHLRIPELTVIVATATGQTYTVNGREVRIDVDKLLPIVSVQSNAPLQIFIGGEVLRPGVIAYRPNLTLLQALVEAGGPKATGALGSVTVLRKNDPQPLVIRRDLTGDLQENKTNDIALQPSDVVILPKTAVASLAQNLEQYVFNLLPPLKNSSFNFTYQIGTASFRTIPQ